MVERKPHLYHLACFFSVGQMEFYRFAATVPYHYMLPVVVIIEGCLRGCLLKCLQMSPLINLAFKGLRLGQTVFSYGRKQTTILGFGFHTSLSVSMYGIVYSMDPSTISGYLKLKSSTIVRLPAS